MAAFLTLQRCRVTNAAVGTSGCQLRIEAFGNLDAQPTHWHNMESDHRPVRFASA